VYLVCVWLRYPFDKVLSFLPFLYFWILLAVTLLYIIDRATLKLSTATAAVDNSFLATHPDVIEKDLRPVMVGVSSTLLIQISAIPLACLMLGYMVFALVRSSAAIVAFCCCRYSSREHKPEVVLGLIIRAFVILAGAFGAWIPEMALMSKDPNLCIDQLRSYHFRFV